MRLGGPLPPAALPGPLPGMTGILALGVRPRAGPGPGPLPIRGGGGVEDLTFSESGSSGLTQRLSSLLKTNFILLSPRCARCTVLPSGPVVEFDDAREDVVEVPAMSRESPGAFFAGDPAAEPGGAGFDGLGVFAVAGGVGFSGGAEGGFGCRVVGSFLGRSVVECGVCNWLR